jgi:hypothetical protein
VEHHSATWDLAGNTAVLQGVCEMDAGSEQCKEPDGEKLLRGDCQLIEICRFNGKFGRLCRRELNGSRLCRRERNGSRRTECKMGA